MSAIKNVALVGATGTIGKHLLDGLLLNGKHTVTAITRAESSATFPSTVKVAKGDYTSKAFLVDALKGQDALIITVPFGADAELQTRFIDAAAEAGVPYILPNEYGSDRGNKAMDAAVPATASKGAYLSQIETLGKSSWIGIVTNPWLDYGLTTGMLGINVKERKALLYDDGHTKINTTTFSNAGIATAKLLSLPEAELSQFKNRFAYLSSFLVSQREILASVQRATGTTDKDWTIDYVKSEDAIQAGWDKVNRGDMAGMVDIMFGHYMKPGGGGNYESKGTVNKLLGLTRENLDDVVKGLFGAS